MAKYINGDWVYPLPREAYFKIGDKVTIHQQEMIVTKVISCCSYSGPVGSLCNHDEELKDEDFKFLYYYVHFNKWKDHDEQLHYPDDRLKAWLDGTNTNYEIYGHPFELYDENPPKEEEKEEEKVPYVPNPLWDFIKVNEEDKKDAINYPLFIGRPNRLGINREEFHNLSVFGLASLFISFRFFFEECPGGIQIYMTETLGYEYAFNKRFEGLNKYKNSSMEFIYIQIPKDNPMYMTIHKLFKDLILY